MTIGIYNPTNRKYNEDDFYCGEKLNKIAIILKMLKDGDKSLQSAYDEIVNDVIINHVIRSSKCECSDYLHELEEFKERHK